MEIICPVCGKKGSLVTKMVRNNYGVAYYYYYVGHYERREGSTRVVSWHYVGKWAPTSTNQSQGDKKTNKRRRKR